MSQAKKFGTLPVFLTSICTILGAILFIRFGWAVGHTGLLGTLSIILIGHLVTIPTALAIAEIATNQRVEGGGAYYIISRSFGINIGGAIGIALYFSQAISVAFYVIAFAQSTGPIFEWVEAEFGMVINHMGFRLVSIPTMGLLALLVLTRGANSGMNLLYLVSFILFVSLLLFFAGTTEYQPGSWRSLLSDTFDPAKYREMFPDASREDSRPAPFFMVFTIIFPAFTGIIAGLGLSGDLKDPGKSIPLGTLAATIVGMLIYIAVAIKMAFSIPLERLANKEILVMSDVALWGPIVPIGLAAATISSALGSILVAPRTLQALGLDKVFPFEKGNAWLAKVRDKDEEPINGSVLTVFIAFIFVLFGDVDFVAEIISMFFMVTYGTICLISFLEHFAANPAYRPSFNSRWYISLPGAILCFWLMFQMKSTYAIGSIVLMVAIYFWVSNYNPSQQGMVRIFQGVIFQISRTLRVTLQKSVAGVEEEQDEEYWVPSMVCISRDSFQRMSPFDMVRFISYRYGFGTFIHLIDGYYSKETVLKSKEVLKRLLKRIKISKSNVFVDTLISPSYTTAVAQVLQLPGISGQDNNMILFEFARNDLDKLQDIISNYNLIRAADFDICILASTAKGYGYKHQIHIWITLDDYENGNLMILLAYIILGHPEWKGGEIKIFAIYPEKEIAKQKENLQNMISAGRLAISPNNVVFISRNEQASTKAIINEKSKDADLTLIGFHGKAVMHDKEEVFGGYDALGNILFVHTEKVKAIS
ncbi:MAG: amino acid permease [Bacteroidota bacterium]